MTSEEKVTGVSAPETGISIANNAVGDDITIDSINPVIDILKKGNPVKYILDAHQKMHIGDTNIAKALLVSIGIQSVLNSDGIQPKLSGESGKGKTHCCKVMAHLMPHEYIITGNYSDKVLYYMAKSNQIPDGCILFMDDVNLTENMEAIIKKSTSAFQTGDTYISLSTKRQPIKMTTPKRLVWWLTSVDDNQSMQLLNRTFTASVDVTKEQDQKVFRYQVEHAISGNIELFENEEVEICREIIRHIKKNNFKVIVPFANDIKWNNTENRRNFSIFIDIIKAFAAIRYMQRQVSSNGYLVATNEDYEDAKLLYEPIKRNQTLKLTDIEIKIFDILKCHSAHNPIDSVLLRQNVGISQERLHQILHGIPNRNKIGMLEKVKGISSEKRTVEMLDINGIVRTQKRFYWSDIEISNDGWGE